MLLIQENRSLKRNSGFASFISKASKKGKRVSGVLSKTEPPEKKVFRHLVKLFDNNGFLLFLLLLTNGGFFRFRRLVRFIAAVFAGSEPSSALQGHAPQIVKDRMR